MPRAALGRNLLDYALKRISMPEEEHGRKGLVAVFGNIAQSLARLVQSDGRRIVWVVRLCNHLKMHARLELVEHQGALPKLEPRNTKRSKNTRRLIHNCLPTSLGPGSCKCCQAGRNYLSGEA